MSPISRFAQGGLFLAFLTLVSGLPTSPVPSMLLTNITVIPSFLLNALQNTYPSTVRPNGQETPIPTISSPKCWFCPKKDKRHDTGLQALPGLDSPQTSQPSSNSEDFDKPLPVINTTSDRDPVYSLPTKTVRDASTKVRRTKDIPTETILRTNEEFDILRKYMPHRIEVKNNERFALTSKKWHWRYGVLYIPAHYNLFTGPVSHVTKEQVLSCNDGSIEKIIETRYYSWKISTWDLRLEDDGKTILYEKSDKSLIDHDNLKNYTLKFLGRLRDDATDATIHKVADGLVEEMNKRGGYDFWFNNCRDFAYFLFKRLRKQE
ncbi:hypothetical protein BDW62DRAFT_205750 [Aspergillus aurantiobrunneus]